MFRIAAISNNRSFLDNAAKFLATYNKDFSVVTLEDPSNINQFLEANPVDIFVCDHNPPQLNALTIFNRRLSANDYRPFILAAKDLGKDTVLQAYEAGIDLCVPMDDTPAVNFLKISNKVIMLVEKHRAEENNRLNDRRLEALVHLSRMHDTDFTTYMNYALEESIVLTNSKIGYLALYDAETQTLDMKIWSKRSMDQCMVQNYPMKYYLPKSGLWGEPVRKKRPFVVNDYRQEGVPRKGLPEGHLHLNRLIMIPLMYNDDVIGTAGVGNKADDYNESDLNQFIMMMEGFTHLYIERKQAEEKMAIHRRLRNVLMNSPTAVLELDGDLNVIDCSDTMKDILGLEKTFTGGPIKNNSWIADGVLELVEKLKYTGNMQYSDTVIGDKDSDGKKYRVRIYTDHEGGQFYLVTLEDYTSIANMSDVIENSLLMRKTFNDLIISTMIHNVIDIRGKIKYLTDGSMRESLHTNLEQIEQKSRVLKEYGDIGILDPEWIRVKDAFELVSSKNAEACVFETHVDGVMVLADYTFGRAFAHLVENSLKSKKLTKIKLTYKVTKGKLLIIYEDDGDGIPYDKKDDLFTNDVSPNSIDFFVVNAIMNTSRFEIIECGDPNIGARYEISVPMDRFEIF